MNFMFSQDAMDLISGHYTVNRNSPSPFRLNGFESLSVSNISFYSLNMILFLLAAFCHQEKCL